MRFCLEHIMHKSISNSSDISYFMVTHYVLKVFQIALQWLVYLTKLSKHHWCLWIKRCTWPHVTVMLSHTFPICSPVLTCVNSCKNTLLAEEIIEAQWYFLILNLYTCIPYCPYFSLCSDKENLLNNQAIFCQWFNLWMKFARQN